MLAVIHTRMIAVVLDALRVFPYFAGFLGLLGVHQRYLCDLGYAHSIRFQIRTARTHLIDFGVPVRYFLEDPG